MAKRKSRQVPSPMETLREQLDAQATGCVSAELGVETIQVYLMTGDIIASASPSDSAAIIRRLVNGGALTERQGDAMRKAVAAGARLDEVLAGQAPDDLVFDLIASRFRQNIFDLLQAEQASFEALESVFVDNIQVGHDSRALLDELHIAAVLRETLPSTTIVRAGSVLPASQAEARLLDLCDSDRALQELFDASPFEEYSTLQAVRSMLDSGALQPTEAPVGQSPTFAFETDDMATEEAAALGATKLEDTLDLWLDDVVPNPQTRGPEEAKASAEGDDWHDDTVVERKEVADAETLDGSQERSGDLELDLEEEATARTDVEGVPVAEDEVAMFEDYDSLDGRGQGNFSQERDNLDRVDLADRTIDEDAPVNLARPTAPLPANDDELIEVGDAETYGVNPDVPTATVSMSFGTPGLESDDAKNMLDVCNEVLSHVSEAMDQENGPGSGQATIQLLVDGTPSEYALLFHGMAVSKEGQLNRERVMKNLAQRPPAEHRRLINRGLRDLIERTLSSTLEELGEEAVERVYAQVAGYEKRLGF